uniref:Uncharacterized protein n=1 Tax=Caloglossa intermedia TaxID=100879 RepID=A0A1Z1M6J0_9FLOR|nr:hypothetical protein [Caloglossa intermedia]ARW61385.1 hypothetical protein [Caloglossa intermedia]
MYYNILIYMIYFFLYKNYINIKKLLQKINNISIQTYSYSI